MTEKLILVDADGVLLSWQDHFDAWMIKKGYAPIDGHTASYHISEQFSINRKHAWELVHQFNNSAAMGYLPALRDSVEYVNKLYYDHGYTFHVITSISDDIYAQRLRTMNLRDLFGGEMFDEITCLATGSNKDEALEPYRNSGLYWIEDKEENSVLGAELGLKSLLIEHSYNKDCNHPGVTKVKNWAEIYNIITT
jgi:hypothetical protein